MSKLFSNPIISSALYYSNITLIWNSELIVLCHRLKRVTCDRIMSSFLGLTGVLCASGGGLAGSRALALRASE